MGLQEKETGAGAEVLTLQQFVDAMNEATPDDYVYTRAQLAAAEARGLAAGPLNLAGSGLASVVANR